VKPPLGRYISDTQTSLRDMPGQGVFEAEFGELECYVAIIAQSLLRNDIFVLLYFTVAGGHFRQWAPGA